MIAMFFITATTGRMTSSSMQAPATKMQVCCGTLQISSLSRPRRPDASKTYSPLLPLGKLPPRGDWILVRRIHRLVGAEPHRQCPPLGRRVADHQRVNLALGEQGHRAAREVNSWPRTRS